MNEKKSTTVEDVFVNDDQGGKKAAIAYVSVVHPLHDHRFLYKQCSGLGANGFEVDYYVRHDRVETIQGVHIQPLKTYKSRVLRALSTFLILPRLMRKKYSIYHLVDPELLPAGILLKLLTGSRVIFDAHEDYVDFIKHKSYMPKIMRSLFSWGIQRVLKISSRLLDGFVFADPGTAELFVGMAKSKQFTFHNYPLRSLFPAETKRWRERTIDVCFVGTMSRTSGMFVMLEAIKHAREKMPDLRCLFIGEPYSGIRSEVDRYLKEHHLEDHVRITGKIPHGEVPQLLQDCKVGLIGLVDIPKFHRNIATKMFEYMASGIPVVSSDLPPERKYIVPDRCGILVPPEDGSAMGDGILRILGDEEFGSRLSDFCREYMAENRYYAEHEIKRLAAFYDEMTGTG